MSIVCSSHSGWLISHYDFVDMIYQNIPLKIKKDLFEIHAPYNKKSRKSKTARELKAIIRCDEVNGCNEVENVRNNYEEMYHEFKAHFSSERTELDNRDALKLSDEIYDMTQKFSIFEAQGLNTGESVIQNIKGGEFIFPSNCKFFCKDIVEISKCVVNDKFDLILLDPPWWNKYIRRKRKKTSHGYSMMYNNTLKELELENMLHEHGLIVVWCTNSSQNINSLKEEIFPKWGVSFTSKWYWLKVTKSGEPVCSFSIPPGKQPFEQIIFGCRDGRQIKNPPNGKIVVSVPSALHSHKPPLVELLKMYLPSEPKCLEIFARYLLPHWTSYGNEVLKFQHESLYDMVE